MWQQYRGWWIGLGIALALVAAVVIYNVDWQDCFNPDPDEAETTITTCASEQMGKWWERRNKGLRQAAATGLLTGSVLGLVALGLTMIFGVLDIVNFSHGALMTIGVYVSFTLFDRYGVDPYVSLIVTIPFLFIIGLIVYRLVIHPARNAPQHNQLLLTLGVALLIENALLLIFTGTPRSMSLPYGRGETTIFPGLQVDFPLKPFDTTITFPRLIAFFGALILTAILYYILRKTDLGRAIRATAQSKDGAALVGIDIDRINMITFGIGTACVGAAAALVLPFPLNVEPTAGNIFNITAFVIVVLGGMGDVRGALLGGLIIGLTQEFTLVLFRGIPKEIGIFVIFIMVLLLRPQGLFGVKRS